MTANTNCHADTPSVYGEVSALLRVSIFCSYILHIFWDDGQTATGTRNEGSSFRFGARQHHARLIVGLA
jgi:hypothetical protein